MRLAFIFLAWCLLLFNCNDKLTTKKLTTATKTSISLKETTTNTGDSLIRAFPKLNSNNAIFFFQKYDQENKENKVRISTDFGHIDLLLFEETKYHRSNFIFLTKQHYFDDTQFYRVIKNFVIQGGNSDDKKTAAKRNKIGRYLLPPDTKKGFKHERGVISMPSSEINNPHKLASPFEFFIVQKQGGAHFLNGDYTVFGRVVKGMDVVDKIASVATDKADWPHENIYIKKVEILK